MKKILLFLWIFSGFVPNVFGQEIAVTDVQLPSQIPFAKPFAAKYQISYPTGYQVTVDEKSFSPDFEITQSAFSAKNSNAGLYDFTVLPFALGKSTFTVTFLLTKDGQEIAKTAVQQTPVEITPVQVFNDKKLREIRAPFMPAGWEKWLLLALLLALIFYAFYLRKKHIQQHALSVHLQQDNRPSDEIALSKIDLLLNSGLWEKKEYKIFYITLSDIFREYLWRQLHVDTSADTSAEVLHRIKKMPALQPLLMPLKDFLISGDLVKFAKDEPTENRRNKDIQILRELVKETTPKPLPKEVKP